MNDPLYRKCIFAPCDPEVQMFEFPAIADSMVFMDIAGIDQQAHAFGQNIFAVL